MTDKEFKRLSRSQLIEIIYQLQLKIEDMDRENRELKDALEDKRLRIAQAGNIAEAALEINNVMQSVQAAAYQYLEEIRIRKMETEEACRQLLEQAQQEARSVSGQTSAAEENVTAERIRQCCEEDQNETNE